MHDFLYGRDCTKEAHMDGGVVRLKDPKPKEGLRDAYDKAEVTRSRYRDFDFFR